MTTTSASSVTEGGEGAWRSFPALFLPITSFQYMGLLTFILLSVVDVVFSAYLIFGAGGYVEGNPLLAWASEGLFLFIVAGLAVKIIGIGMLVLLVSFANRFFTLAGDSVVVAAIGTTLALFLLMLVL